MCTRRPVLAERSAMASSSAREHHCTPAGPNCTSIIGPAIAAAIVVRQLDIVRCGGRGTDEQLFDRCCGCSGRARREAPRCPHRRSGSGRAPRARMRGGYRHRTRPWRSPWLHRRSALYRSAVCSGSSSPRTPSVPIARAPKRLRGMGPAACRVRSAGSRIPAASRRRRTKRRSVAHDRGRWQGRQDETPCRCVVPARAIAVMVPASKAIARRLGADLRGRRK